MGQLSAETVKMNHEVESLESITEAWSRQERFLHTKIVVSLI